MLLATEAGQETVITKRLAQGHEVTVILEPTVLLSRRMADPTGTLQAWNNPFWTILKSLKVDQIGQDQPLPRVEGHEVLTSVPGRLFLAVEAQPKGPEDLRPEESVTALLQI